MTVFSVDTPLLIVGLSRSGIAAAKLAHSLGFRSIRITDTTSREKANPTTLGELNSLGITVELGGHSDESLTQFKQVIVSPGLAPRYEVIQRLLAAGALLQSEVEFAWQHRPADSQWIGITGTNGKTTVTELTTYLLNHASHNAVACGNNGYPAAEAVLEARSRKKRFNTFVLELSSYQLHYSDALALDAVGLTQVGEDHVAWHETLIAYHNAKRRLFEQSRQVWVLNADDTCATTWEKELPSPQQLLWTSIKSKETDFYLQNDSLQLPNELSLLQSELALKGRHNAHNVLTALALCKSLGTDLQWLLPPLKRFTGVTHRMEALPSVNGVEVYNDSKATNPEASIEAIQAFSQGVHLLAGGVDKQTDLSAWVQAVKTHCTMVYLYGINVERMQSALEAEGAPLKRVDTLETATESALSEAQPGETILLSPACASFDQFKDFEARGDAFKALMHSHTLNASSTSSSEAVA